MNLTDRQYAFVERQLRVSALAVGIDLDVSADALIALAMFSDNLETDLGDLCSSETIYQEAVRLTKVFNSKSGAALLVHMGNACMMADRSTWLSRSWETDDFLDEWSGDETNEDVRINALACRVLCDFAMSTGIAANHCAAYLDPNKPASLGGIARAIKYENRKAKVLRICEAEFQNWRDESAEKIAGEIYGRPGIDLSYRRIAEVIRSAKK